MKVVRRTTAMESQRRSFPEDDIEALLDPAFQEDEAGQSTGSIKAKGSGKHRSSELFNITQEQVDDPQYWIDL